MKWIVSMAVLALATCCAYAELDVVKVCQPGATWNDGCNDCRCTDTGVALCTQRACLPAPSLEPAQQAECKEGDVWQEDCNTCRCANGRKACTYKLCLGGGQDRPDPNNCTPGATWKQDCNSCRCTPTGRAACTLMACLGGGNGGTNNGEGPVVGNECTPGTSWRQDCNGCRCTATGRAICTQMACLSKRSVKPERVGDECTPGTTWKKDCNTCTCESSGLASCTKIGCVHELLEVRDEHAVVADAEPSAPAAETSERRCAQGEVWKQACNTCRCTTDGLPACTKMRCVTKPIQE